MMIPGLPPQLATATPWELAEARLDHAAALLAAAVQAGYADVAHMSSDLDLTALRERRSIHFLAVLQKVIRGMPRQVPVGTAGPALCSFPPTMQHWLLA